MPMFHFIYSTTSILLNNQHLIMCTYFFCNATILTIPDILILMICIVDDKMLVGMQNLSFAWYCLPTLGGTIGGNTHTHTYTYIDIDIDIDIDTHTHTHWLARTHKRTRIGRHTHIHIYIHQHAFADTRARTHSDTHTQSHRHKSRNKTKNKMFSINTFILSESSIGYSAQSAATQSSSTASVAISRSHPLWQRCVLAIWLEEMI